MSRTKSTVVDPSGNTHEQTEIYDRESQHDGRQSRPVHVLRALKPGWRYATQADVDAAKQRAIDNAAAEERDNSENIPDAA